MVLTGLLVLQGLNPGPYSKLIDAFEVGTIDWSAKKPYKMEEELKLVDHCKMATGAPHSGPAALTVKTS